MGAKILRYSNSSEYQNESLRLTLSQLADSQIEKAIVQTSALAIQGV